MNSGLFLNSSDRNWFSSSHLTGYQWMDNRFLNSSAAVDRWFYVPVKCSGITKISYNGEAARGGDAIESISFFFFLFY